MTDRSYKTLVVCDDVLQGGGVGTHLRHAFAYLPERGFDMHLLDLTPERTPVKPEFAPFRDRMTALPQPSWRSEERHRKAIRDVVRRVQPDLIVLHEWRFAEDLLRGSPGLPVVNVCHRDRPGPKYYDLAAALVPYLDAVTGVSPLLTAKVKAHIEPRWHDKVTYLPLGVVPAEPRPRSNLEETGRLNIIYVGTLKQQYKCVRDMVPFVERLHAAGVSFRLSVVGEGDENAFLREELRGHVDAGRVVFRGFLPHDEAMGCLADQDVLVLFSDYEGLPLCLLEGLMRGVVPVVTNVESGVSEILEDGVHGRLYPIGEPAAGADLAAELAREPERTAALRKRAIELGREFSIGPSFDAYAELFERVIGAARRGERPVEDPSPLFTAGHWKEAVWKHMPTGVVRLWDGLRR